MRVGIAFEQFGKLSEEVIFVIVCAKIKVSNKASVPFIDCLTHVSEHIQAKCNY